MTKFISYIRVSTAKQGASGLGLEAQQAAVSAFLKGKGELIGEFVEVETGKGADALARRPQLRAALDTCKRQGAVLLIAKLDRLARNVHFVSGLMESGVEFIAADMPQANKVMLHIHAVMAEHERDQISERTKAALRAAKARGVRLGVAGPANLRPNIEQRQAEADQFAGKYRGLIEGLKARGVSQRGMVDELNSLEIKTQNGGRWSLVQVQRLISRQAAL